MDADSLEMIEKSYQRQRQRQTDVDSLEMMGESYKQRIRDAYLHIYPERADRVKKGAIALIDMNDELVKLMLGKE